MGTEENHEKPRTE